MTTFEPDDILNSIVMNADRNLHNNAALIHSPYQAVDLAGYYVDACRTLIARDVLNCPDKMELLEGLGNEINEMAFLIEVMNTYIEEVSLQIEMETAGATYTFNKTNRKKCNETNNT